MPLIHQSNQSTIARMCGAETGWESSRKAWELLHVPLNGERRDDAQIHIPDQTQTLSIRLPEGEISLLNGVIDSRIWCTLGLSDHRVICPTSEDIQGIEAALKHLATMHPQLFDTMRGFLKALAMVDLLENPSPSNTLPSDPSRLDAAPLAAASCDAANPSDGLRAAGLSSDGFRAGCLTSASIPDLPFCSFISRRAWHHIPPQILSLKPDRCYLAENLYHESVHHRVTLNLLENDLLQPDYHTQLSPRIAIPWRQASPSRSQFWELDRVLHAFSVYVALLPYRLTEARAAPQSPWPEAFSQARVCAHFLGEALLSHQHVLTPRGYAYVSEQWSQYQAYGPDCGLERVPEKTPERPPRGSHSSSIPSPRIPSPRMPLQPREHTP